MIFKKLIFNNFKAYYGHQELNLDIPREKREQERKNIILIGGLNGTGKTSILRAILYVLFGQRGITEEEYRRIFSNTINNTYFDEGGRECSLTLVLETDQGEEWELITKWLFDHNKKAINETREIIVRKPGVRIGQHAHVANIHAYNRFIDRMIPYHAAPFFIFDGEEIKDIILRQNSAEMKEAIHRISGIEAYKQLIDDLEDVQNSLYRKLSKGGEIKKKDSLQLELSQIEQEIDQLNKRHKSLMDQKKRLESLISEAKKSREHKISINSKSRENVLKKQVEYQTQLDLAIEEFIEDFKNNIIFIILKEQIMRLKERIRAEKEQIRKREAYETALIPYRNFIDQLLSVNLSPPLTEEQLRQLKVIGEKVWAKENNFEMNDDIEILHDLNNADYSYLINLPQIDKTRLINKMNYIEKLKENIEQTEQELRNAPESVDIELENNQIDLHTKELGRIELRLRAVLKRLTEFEDKKRELQNKITRTSKNMEDFDELKRQYDFTVKVKKAMEHYIKDMTLLKAQFIHDEFANMLNKLFRKKDEFGKIEFDIHTYTVRLFNDRNQEISIHDRSAGEMQMIASAFIWALTKASELSLPMVIDTPLGRLDSYHRKYLIEYYYKELSDQVIILSTDTEITKDYVELMKEHSYKQYMLEYDQSKKYTIIREGYFNFIEV